MTIEELYNVLEKAIDSGYSQRSRIPIIDPISETEIDSEGDLILIR